MHTSKPLIAITMGDPCGIGPEIIVRALLSNEIHACCTPVVLGDRGAMERAIALLGSSLKLITLADDELPEGLSTGSIYLQELTSLAAADTVYGQPTRASGDAVFRYITAAANLCMNGKVAAMATAPINKAAMNLAGHLYPGHTELLAELTGAEEFVMMLAGERLRVALVTIHEAISAVPELVTYNKVLATIMTTHRDVARFFCQKPRIAVLSLNPHAGEGEMFGDHESRIILPAIVEARRRGVDATGPHSADTLFHFAARGDYDAVVCMYHDQGLIPLKLLHFDDGVNITLGLPIIRTSVDHGTAYNIAGKGIASAESMQAAILTAAKMANYSI
ncbi:MAG: 4-hydroxythreonine-4-phosphate dehydrogenase PdxA [Deltaproteobacteria bacterium HGW-Deltaproteobacteria-23]|nr:MAG: 4-hydroxythreonine-4-phosphate dehydrogenase PdxA [Deltaproteobacteria bacterium HGW-Deltaproteobacteria-23]